MAGQTGQAAPAATSGGSAKASVETDSLGGMKRPEHAFVEKAREEAQSAATPRD